MTLPFKFIREFDQYEVAYSREATRLLNKPHWYTKNAYVFFLGDKFSNRCVFVPKGFFTDGSSTPSLLQSLLPVLGDHGASVIMHDRLCETGYCLEVSPKGDVVRVKLTRKEIDDIFIDSLRVIGMDRVRIRLIDLGLTAHRGFNSPPSANPNPKKDAFQDRFILDHGITNIREEQIYDYLSNDLKFLFNETAA